LTNIIEQCDASLQRQNPHIPSKRHFTLFNLPFTDFSFTKVLIFAFFEAADIITDNPIHYDQKPLVSLTHSTLGLPS